MTGLTPDITQVAVVRHGVDEAAAHVRPIFGVTTAHNDDVGRQPQAAERAAQPDRLPGLIVDMGFDDEKSTSPAGSPRASA